MADELDDAHPIVDVTAEIVGERREEYRAGFDAGIREGTRRFLHGLPPRKGEPQPTIASDALAKIALELSILRTLYAGVCEALVEAEYQIAVLEQELDYRAPDWDKVTRH